MCPAPTPHLSVQGVPVVAGHITVQSEASQLSRVWSVRQIGVSAGSRRGRRRFGAAQRFDLGFGVDLGVAVGGGQVGVPEPAADDVDLDAGFEQVDGRGVPEECAG